MSFKKFFGAAVAIGVLVSAMSVTNVFAASPTFVVGEPVDAITGEEVTEFTAGQIIEVPIDITNVDSGKLSMSQLELYYDNTVFTPGIDTTDEASEGYTYYGMYTETLFAMDPTDEAKGIYRVVARNNMQGRTKGNISGNCYAETDSMTMLWTITGLNSVAVSDTLPEYYMAFTVKSDFVAPEELNVEGSQSLTGTGLFALKGTKVDETTTINHPSITGEQNNAKLNACYGAFNINIDSSVLPYWVQGLYVSVNGGAKVAVSEYKTTDNVTYTFPVRVTTNSTNATTATVEVFADTSSDESGTADVQSAVSMGTFDIQLNSPSSYADNIVTAQ